MRDPIAWVSEFAAMLKVISASRRIDLVAVYPQRMVEILRQKAPPEQTHSLVIWTKNPANLIAHADLQSEVRRYRNLYLHLTVTGLGGGILEPRAPAPEVVLAVLPRVIDFVGGPEHVRFRFDPIVHIRLPDGDVLTNLKTFEALASAIAAHGVRDVSISWMQEYRKVLANLHKKRMAPVAVPPTQWQREHDYLKRIAARHALTLHGCCVPGMPRSRCIDGELLMRLHPDEAPCSTKRAKGQRELCGCTESFDVGWYEPCRHGCIYCYANPLID